MSRRLLAAVLLLAAFALALAGFYRPGPPAEELVVVEPLAGSAARVAPEGLRWRIPLATRIARYVARPFEAELGFRPGDGSGLASREGADLRLVARVELRPDPRKATILHEALGARYRDPAALTAALTPALRAAAATHDYEDLLALDASARQGLAAGLRAGAASLGLILEGEPALAAWPEVYPRGRREDAGEGKILLVGLDGADWNLIDPLLERGLLPNLAGLVARGTRARLKTITPALSPIIWTSVATGKLPEKHGIRDFLAVDSRTGREMPVTSTMRTARPFWGILSGRGISVGTVAWWATWPAEPVLGFQVSDRVAYQLFGRAGEGEGLRGRTWPEGLILSLAPFVERGRAAAEGDLREILGREADPGVEDEQALGRILLSTRIYHEAALRLLGEYGPRVAAVYYEGTDTAAHLFMRYAPPRLPGVGEEEVARWGGIVENTYRLHDRLLGDLLAVAGPGATVLVVSDHGFRTGSARPSTDPRIGVGGAADWHRKFGILLAAGPAIRRGAAVDDLSILDVTPTLLAILGLPVGADMDGAVATGLFEAGAAALRASEPLATWEGEGGGPGAPVLAGEVAGSAEVDREMIAKLTALGYIGQTGANAENNAGITLLGQGRPEEAAAAFRSATAKDPAFAGARVNLARALMAQKDWAGALAELQAVRSADPNAPDVENLIGNVFMETGDDRRAEATFRGALDRDPRNPHLWNSLGIVLQRLGRREEALEAYRRVVSLDADYAEAINNAGLVLREQGRAEAARAEFEKAIEVDPDFPGSYNNLGMTLQDLGDPRGALEAFDRGLKVDPENPVILNNRGSTLLGLGRHEEAREAFEKAVAADPAYASARSNLGAALGLLGDPEREFEEYLRALELDPGDPDIRFNIALSLRRRGRAGEAERALRDVLARRPDHVRALHELGILLAGDGRTAESLRSLERAKDLAPRWIPPRSALAQILAASGRTGEALREARAALALDPNQPELEALVARLAATSGSKP